MDYLPVVPSVLPATEIIRLLGHLVLGGITCYGVGLAKLRVQNWPWWLVACVAFATTWHFLWDWIAFDAWASESMAGWQTGAAIALMMTGLAAYGLLVVLGSGHSRRVFPPLEARDLWGWPFSLWRR